MRGRARAPRRAAAASARARSCGRSGLGSAFDVPAEAPLQVAACEQDTAAAAVADEADVRAQAHHRPAALAAGVGSGQLDAVPQAEFEYPPRRGHGLAPCSVAPVNVKALRRSAGTTTRPRYPRRRRRSRDTASTPASAAR